MLVAIVSDFAAKANLLYLQGRKVSLWRACKPETKIKIIVGFCEPDASPKPRSRTRANGA